MKRLILIGVVLGASTMWAQDGAATFKAKCAMCHGPAGEGKSGPKLAGTSMSEQDIADLLTKGGKPKAPHTKAYVGVTEDQAKAVAAYVKTLK